MRLTGLSWAQKGSSEVNLEPNSFNIFDSRIQMQRPRGRWKSETEKGRRNQAAWRPPLSIGDVGESWGRQRETSALAAVRLKACLSLALKFQDTVFSSWTMAGTHDWLQGWVKLN
jgi:hypothetical protein